MRFICNLQRREHIFRHSITSLYTTLNACVVFTSVEITLLLRMVALCTKKPSPQCLCFPPSHPHMQTFTTSDTSTFPNILLLLGTAIVNYHVDQRTKMLGLFLTCTKNFFFIKNTHIHVITIPRMHVMYKERKNPFLESGSLAHGCESTSR